MESEVKRLMALGYSQEEAVDMATYDKQVDKGLPTKYDLTKEQEKVARQYTRTGTKKTTVYNLDATGKTRKPNELKQEIINLLFSALQNYNCTDLTITNKERMIAFGAGGESFEITLTQKRKPKK